MMGNIGRLLAVLMLAGLAGCNRIAPQPVSATNAARYQITYSPIAVRDTFLLDTSTGETWQLVVDKDHNELWQKMQREDSNAVSLSDSDRQFLNGTDSSRSNSNDSMAVENLTGYVVENMSN